VRSSWVTLEAKRACRSPKESPARVAATAARSATPPAAHASRIALRVEERGGGETARAAPASSSAGTLASRVGEKPREAVGSSSARSKSPSISSSIDPRSTAQSTRNPCTREEPPSRTSRTKTRIGGDWEIHEGTKGPTSSATSGSAAAPGELGESAIPASSPKAPSLDASSSDASSEDASSVVAAPPANFLASASRSASRGVVRDRGLATSRALFASESEALARRWIDSRIDWSRHAGSPAPSSTGAVEARGVGSPAVEDPVADPFEDAGASAGDGASPAPEATSASESSTPATHARSAASDSSRAGGSPPGRY